MHSTVNFLYNIQNKDIYYTLLLFFVLYFVILSIFSHLSRIEGLTIDGSCVFCVDELEY